MTPIPPLHRLAALIAALLLPVCAGCGSDPTPAPAKKATGACDDKAHPQRFHALFGGPGKDTGRGVTFRSGGGVLLTGTREVGGVDRAWVVATDAEGTLAWQHTLAATHAHVVIEHDGGALVVEEHFTGYLFAKDGANAWQKKWGAELQKGYETAYGGIVYGKGWLLVGTRFAGTGEKDSRKARVLHLSAAGEPEWDQLRGIDGRNEAADVVGLSDGDFALVGTASQPISDVGEQVWLLVGDSHGDKLWDKRLGGALDERGVGIEAAGGRDLYIAASTRSKGAGQNDLWLLRTDDKGNIQWDKTFGGEANDDPTGLAKLADGSLVATGRHTSEMVQPGGVWLLRTDAQGKLLWERTFGRAWQAEGAAIAAQGDEFAVAATTSVNGNGSDDLWLLRGGPDGKAWCPGNRAAPCLGAGAEACIPELVCSKDFKPAQCMPK